MKNEQRYGGIIQAQMKDLGVLLPRGRERGGQGDGGGEVWKKNWKKHNWTVRMIVPRILFSSLFYLRSSTPPLMISLLSSLL